MSATVYVPRDSGSVSLGAGRVADAIAAEARRRGVEIRLVRNGSRGLYWLEPLVEVDTARGRVGYGPVFAAGITTLFGVGFRRGGEDRRSPGAGEELPYLKRPERVTFA